jgi:hypothetical protein
VRKSRPVRAGGAGKWRTETVYAITDLPPHQARPDELAAWIRGHGQIENGLHWGPRRDLRRGPVPGPHRSRPAGHGHTLRILVISLHRLADVTNIAKALRHHARDALRPLQLLKII